jgi:phage host-nuclease inhibitor protein Gam
MNPPVFPITSVDQLNDALAAVGKLNGEEARLNAELDRQLAHVREQMKVEWLVPTEAGEVVLSVARQQMLDEIKAYCEEHRGELLTEEKKSLELTHGTIGWTKQPDSIDIVKPKGKKAETSLLTKLTNLATAAITKAKVMLGKSTALSLVRVKVDWDKVAIMKAVTSKQLTNATMAKEGIFLKQGQDQFYCEPKGEAVVG